MNFSNMGDLSSQEGNYVKQSGNLSLARQSSVYSLTFDEFQNTCNGVSKDFGSMNMDELLKNIWTVEETQNTSLAATGVDPPVKGNDLHRQGSVALPRTISQKTVDEVWKDMLKECKNGSNFSGNFSQRQQTLGEMTLEDFLARAGIAREDPETIQRTANAGFFGELLQSNNAMLPSGLRNSMGEVNNLATNQVSNLGFGMDNATSQHALAFGSDPQLDTPNGKSAILAFANPPMNNGMIPLQSGVGVGVVNLGNGVSSIGGAPPANLNQACSNGTVKSSVDTNSSRPVPYPINGGLQGRKTGALEKVVERRQRRMIKNRESAARSRARKQAYTLELEAEVAKLKELNMELQRKQAEILEIQKKEIMERDYPWIKKPCLRRTLTGPW